MIKDKDEGEDDWSADIAFISISDIFNKVLSNDDGFEYYNQVLCQMHCSIPVEPIKMDYLIMDFWNERNSLLEDFLASV